MSTIVLNTLNYTGTGFLNGASYFWERAAGLATAFSPIVAHVNLTQDKANVLWKLTIPVVVAADSTCGCAGEVSRVAVIDISFRMDKMATAAERLDALNRVKDLVKTTQFGESVTGLVVPT